MLQQLVVRVLRPMRLYVPLVAVVALIVGLLVWLRPTPAPERAPAPPAADAPRPEPPQLAARAPVADPERAALLYAEAITRGDQYSAGARAFRAQTDAYVDYNIDLAKTQADKEGLTLDEVRELTYFGHLAFRAQQWDDVERLTGQPLSEDQRQLGYALVDGANAEFKLRMRELVADGAPVEQRWQLIRDTEDEFMREYFALTGMTPERFDELLAGELANRKYAASTVDPDPAALDAPERTEEDYDAILR